MTAYYNEFDFGLASQPFFFYATWTAGQYGMLALTALYAIGWATGIYNHWIRPAWRRRSGR